MFRFAGSVVLWGGRGTADKCHWPVWGALTVFRPHWVCPRSWVCVLSPSTLLRLPAALYGVVPVLWAVPVLGYSTKAQTRLGLSFVLSLARAAQAAGSLTSTLSLGTVCLLPSAVPALVSALRLGAPCVCSGELVSSCDPPSGCQLSRISGSLWLKVGNLFA